SAPSRHPPLFPPCLCSSHCPPRALHSFPTRRSSDLLRRFTGVDAQTPVGVRRGDRPSHRQLRRPDRVLCDLPLPRRCVRGLLQGDRKSTRLNSSHVSISYAVFCLKKKTNYDAAPSTI